MRTKATGQWYVAKQGDTFDSIALGFYAEETLAGVILRANPAQARTLVFEGGERLWIPPVAREQSADALPPWRRT